MVTRRRFLLSSSGLALSAWWAGPFALAAGARGKERPRALCLVQLTGGNDALNMLVPYEDDHYWRARPTLAAPTSALHQLNDQLALHPSMPALAERVRAGQAAIVQGVGYPNPDRSHFRSMEIWHTARLAEPCGDVGWLGSVADELARAGARAGRSDLVALGVGVDQRPLALAGREFIAPCFSDASGLAVHPELARLARERDALLAFDPAASATAERAFLRDVARASYQAAERMSELAARGPQAEYPATDLGRRLQLVARLVAGGFGTQLFHVEMTGFDTHARQGPAHAALLDDLSRSLDAFQRDLEAAGVGGDIATFVFSEFGRRVAENQSRGTDHGKAGCAIVLAPNLNAGVLGTGPDLGLLDDGDLSASTDFRTLYASLERDWLGVNTGLAAEPFPLFA